MFWYCFGSFTFSPQNDFSISGKMKMVVRFSVYVIIFKRVSIATFSLLVFLHKKKQISTKGMCQNVVTSEKS